MSSTIPEPAGEMAALKAEVARLRERLCDLGDELAALGEESATLHRIFADTPERPPDSAESARRQRIAASGLSVVR